MDAQKTADKVDFNSRPSARGDAGADKGVAVALDFNSRPSARGDGSTGGSRGIECLISIHVPPRGATGGLVEGQRALVGDFNSRPSARGDATHRHLPLNALYFNSRPSARGDDALGQGAHGGHFDFNSRPSARGDGNTFGARKRYCISIHVPPRGATCPWGSLSSPRRLFQFTSLREGRRQKICNFCKSFVQPLQISMA